MALCIFSVRRVRSGGAADPGTFPEFTLNKINVSERGEIGKHPLHTAGNAGSVRLKYRLVRFGVHFLEIVEKEGVGNFSCFPRENLVHERH